MQRGCSILLLIALLPQMALPQDALICLCAAIQCPDCKGSCDRALFAANSGEKTKACCRRCAETTTSVRENRPCRGCVVLAPHNHDVPKPQPQSDRSIPDALPVQETWLSILDGIWESRGPALRPTVHAPPDAHRALPLLI